MKRLKEDWNPQNKQQMKEAVVQAECNSMVMSVGRRLDAVIARKGSGAPVPARLLSMKD